MVLFTNTFRAQSEPLSPEDFSALWTCLRAVDALAFYNCGDKSGARCVGRSLALGCLRRGGSLALSLQAQLTLVWAGEGWGLGLGRLRWLM
jgi:hypothetical protein